MLIAIPALAKHKPIVMETVAHLLSNGHTCANIFVVTPDVGEYSCGADGKYRVLHEASVEKIGKLALAQQLGGRSSRAGWYYQQLLKYAIVEYLSSSGFVLVCDADTVLLSDLSKLYGGFPSAREWNPAYFEGLKMLTGLSPVLRRSAIVNFMMFDAKYMKSLLLEIEARSGKRWWIAIADMLARNPEIEFSEYEVYANWEASEGGRDRSMPFRMFRRADLLLTSISEVPKVIKECSSAGYQAVAFEFDHHHNYLKRIFARLVLMAGVDVW